jgi:hypothetical protein
MTDENLKKVNADSENLKMATRAENLKKINDELEKLSDEELEQVAGGTRLETFADGNELYKRGLLDGDDALHSAPVRDLLHKMGYSGYKDNGGLLHGNIYTDKNGNQISREDFWKNFDDENGTKVIR